MDQECVEAQGVAVRRRLFSTRTIGAILIASASCLASAQIPSASRAGVMAENCSQMLKGTGQASQHADCATRIAAFMAGWTGGVRRGLAHSTIQQRPRNDTRSDRELAAVARTMYPVGSCLGKTDFDQIAQGFIDYIAAKPSRSDEIYGYVLGDYFLDELCER